MQPDFYAFADELAKIAVEDQRHLSEGQVLRNRLLGIGGVGLGAALGAGSFRPRLVGGLGGGLLGGLGGLGAAALASRNPQGRAYTALERKYDALESQALDINPYESEENERKTEALWDQMQKIRKTPDPELGGALPFTNRDEFPK